MDTTTQLYGRRAVIAGAAGVAGLGLATLAGSRFAAAQVTPEADEEATRRDEIEAEVAARYDDFVSRLATSLGLTDTASVDTGIRDALTGMIEARLEAGEISANDAEAATTAIASSPAPLFGLMIAGGRGRQRRGHGGFRGGFDGFGDPDDDETDTEDAIPATPAATV